MKTKNLYFFLLICSISDFLYAQNSKLEPLNPAVINPKQLGNVQLVIPQVPPMPNISHSSIDFHPPSTPIEIPYNPNAYQKKMNDFIKNIQSMSIPSSSQQSYFDKWLYNTKVQSAFSCWKHAHQNLSIHYPDLPKMISNAQTTFFDPPEQKMKDWCEHISTNYDNIQPTCYNIYFYGDTLPTDSYSQKYVHLHRTNGLLNVKVSADCFIDSKKMVPQPFVGSVKATMTESPKQGKVMTSFGLKNAIVGELDITIPGFPIEESKNKFVVKAIFGVIQ